jgi:hypothetical protein
MISGITFSSGGGTEKSTARSGSRAFNGLYLDCGEYFKSGGFLAISMKSEQETIFLFSKTILIWIGRSSGLPEPAGRCDLICFNQPVQPAVGSACKGRFIEGPVYSQIDRKDR